MPSAAATALAVEKLASSGLTAGDAKLLGMDAHDGAEMPGIHPSFKALPTLSIPYFDPLTRKPMSARPRWPAFVRYRYLQAPEVPSGKKRVQKYAQAPNTGSCAYFPLSVDWAAIFPDPDVSLFITEGELKAAKTCKEGFPCIGLGGVWNFQSTQACSAFLPELEKVNWVHRNVYIIYDSDARDKPDVVDALNALAHELADRGALVYTVLLPDVCSPEKTGLDDWFVHEPRPEKFIDLVTNTRESLTLAQPLWDNNTKVALVHQPYAILHKRTGQLMSVGAYKEGHGANQMVAELKLKPDGEVSLKKTSLPAAWLKWPMRESLSTITYVPGGPQVITEERAWNTWKGWGTTPVKGDVSLYTKLVDHLFSTTSKEAKEWFLRWCAYPIQHPGTKMYSAIAIHGVRTGTGKSFLFYCLGRIYGKNFTEIREADLHGSFNGWAQDKQLVLGDDVTGSDKRAHADMLKAMITQKELRVNIKYVPDYTVPDCVNYAFTSQSPDAFFLEDDDRRFFVHEVTVDPLPHKFYIELEEWLASEAGGNALHHYLLNLPMGDFDHRSRALSTAAKEAMIDVGKSDLAMWCDRLRESPDHILKFGQAPVQGDLFSARDLTTIYDPYGAHKVTANGMAKALRRAMFAQVNNGAPVRWSAGQERYYVVRNREQWVKATPAKVREHLERTRK